MQKVSLQQAVKMTGKSESTIRRAVKTGKVSAERDERGHLKFDIAELQRAYAVHVPTLYRKQWGEEISIPLYNPEQPNVKENPKVPIG